MSWFGFNMPTLATSGYGLYCDIIKGSQNYKLGDGTQCPIDALGNPTQDFHICCFLKPLDGPYVGDFTLSFIPTTGTYPICHPEGYCAHLVMSAPKKLGNRIVITVSLGVETNMGFYFTGTGKGVTDLRIIRPGFLAPDGFSSTREFVPSLSALMQGGGVRWMEGTNSSGVVTPADMVIDGQGPYGKQITYSLPNESDPTKPHIITAGVNLPPESQARGSQSGGAQWAHMNIPAMGNDAVRTRYFKAWHDHYAGRVESECSNEPWNTASGFWQNTYYVQLAKQLIAAGNNPIATWAKAPGNTYANDAAHLAQVAYIYQIYLTAPIGRAIFADNPSRLKILCNVQINNGDTFSMSFIRQFLKCEPRSFIDKLVTAPYFNPGQETPTLSINDSPTATPAEILAGLTAGIPIAVAKAQKVKALADAYGLDFGIYEFGNSMASRTGNLAAKIAALTSSQMRYVQRAYMIAMRTAFPNATMLHYSAWGPFSTDGCWGAYQIPGIATPVSTGIDDVVNPTVDHVLFNHLDGTTNPMLPDKPSKSVTVFMTDGSSH